MKVKKSIALIIAIGFVIMNASYIQAQDNNEDIIITTDIDKTQSRQQFNGTVHIQYNEAALYNDMVKLSYHIYDKNNQILLFENERLPVTLIDGKADISLSIDLNNIQSISNEKKLIIRFDLVDEKNIYWYSDTPGINMKTVEIIYENTFWSRLNEVYGEAFSQQKIQLIISFLFIFILFYVYRKFKKNC